MTDETTAGPSPHGTAQPPPAATPPARQTIAWRRVMTWGYAAFLIFLIALRPGAAADVFTTVGSAVTDLVQGFGEFIHTPTGREDG